MTVVYKLRHRLARRFLSYSVTRFPEGDRHWRLNLLSDTQVWSTDSYVKARAAAEYFCPDDWDEATYDRPISMFRSPELEIVRVTWIEEVV